MSPPIAKKQSLATQGKKDSVAFVVSKLMEQGYEFICLCEVSNKDIDFLIEHAKSNFNGYYCARGAEKRKNVFFDTCIFYRKENELLRNFNKDSLDYTFEKGRSTVKYCQKYKFSLPIDEEIILYLSHWPSNIRNVEEKRDDIAIRLRINIEEGLKETNKILVIGDFNVEPYHSAITNKIQSSRSKSVVLKNKMTFYNPCWKFMCLDQMDVTSLPQGTHFYKQADLFHEWHVLDQVFVSKEFLIDPWNFKDENVTILEQKKMIDGIGFSYNESDHHPISVTIGRHIECQGS